MSALHAYNLSLGARTKASLLFVLFILVGFIVIQFNGENIKKITDQEACEVSFKSRSHYYCLNTLEDVTDTDDEGNFVIPKRNILLGLRSNVLDCLFQRYITNLQTYCSRQDKHGTCSKGWNLCVDGCYKPNRDTVIRVISHSAVYNDTRLDSVTNNYQSRVLNYAPKSIGEGIFFQQIEFNWTSSQIKFQGTNFIDDVYRLKRKDDILIIDVGNMTNQTIQYILENKLLAYFKQISIRTQYFESIKSHIDYVSALYHLSQFYSHGFRIYWYQMEWDCMIKGDMYRTSCVTINLIHKKCGKKAESINQQHLIIPDDITLSRYNSDYVAVFYQRYLTSIQTHCKDILRLGGILDGGWEVCHDEKYRPKQSCLVYSFGINFDFKFDDAVADVYGCEVHSFDPSMKKKDYQHSRHVSFHNLGVLDEKHERDVTTGWRLSTLKYIREDLGHTYRKLDIIKMDIEESEWRALPEMIQSGVLRDVSQIFIEFHSIGTKLHLKVLRLLYDEGFRIFWYHRNPYCCMHDRLFEYSLCNEVYFVKEQV